jgi:hypothetical protein
MQLAEGIRIYNFPRKAYLLGYRFVYQYGKHQYKYGDLSHDFAGLLYSITIGGTVGKYKIKPLERQSQFYISNAIRYYNRILIAHT